MNSLNFSANSKIFNLTPFKFSVCCLINSFLRDKELESRYDISLLLDGILLLTKEYESEVNLSILYVKLQKIVNITTKENNKIEHSVLIFNYIKKVLEYYYSNIKSISDIVIIFNNEISKLEVKDGNEIGLLETGSFIHGYIRKCLFAFYKLKFEDLCDLFEKIELYTKGETLTTHMTNKESENTFLIQFDKLTFPINNNQNLQNNEDVLNSINYKHKYYFYSKAEDPSSKIKYFKFIKIVALFNTHKFFDYNMKYFYNGTTQEDTKIHYALLNVVEYYYNHYYYKQGLEGINLICLKYFIFLALTECVKLTQSSWDHEGLLKCFIWMQKIYRNIGNSEIVILFLLIRLLNVYKQL